MNEYHIGKEIEKEVRSQSLSVDAFAKALNRERQTVYDIFKRAHIATDRLMEISRLLNRDFFKELSDICMKGSISTEEESVIKDCISMLMPENELQIIRPEHFQDLADEYFQTPRTKPLVVFYDNSENPILKTLHDTGEKTLGVGKVKTIQTGNKYPLNAVQIENLAKLPYKAIEIFYNPWGQEGCDSIILLAERLIEASGKFVIVYCQCVNTLSNGYQKGKVAYNNEAERYFETFKESVHIFVADNYNNDFVRRQEIYHACNQIGYIDRIYDEFVENNDDEAARALLEKAIAKRSTFTIVKEEKNGSAIRRYVVSAVPTVEEKEVLKSCRLFPEPKLSIWYDVDERDGRILYHQYDLLQSIHSQCFQL